MYIRCISGAYANVTHVYMADVYAHVIHVYTYSLNPILTRDHPLYTREYTYNVYIFSIHVYTVKVPDGR